MWMQNQDTIFHHAWTADIIPGSHENQAKRTLLWFIQTGLHRPWVLRQVAEAWTVPPSTGPTANSVTISMNTITINSRGSSAKTRFGLMAGSISTHMSGRFSMAVVFYTLTPYSGGRYTP